MLATKSLLSEKILMTRPTLEPGSMLQEHQWHSCHPDPKLSMKSWRMVTLWHDYHHFWHWTHLKLWYYTVSPRCAFCRSGAWCTWRLLHAWTSAALCTRIDTFFLSIEMAIRGIHRHFPWYAHTHIYIYRDISILSIYVHIHIIYISLPYHCHIIEYRVNPKNCSSYYFSSISY